jgi:hypothetical protein
MGFAEDANLFGDGERLLDGIDEYKDIGHGVVKCRLL